jgi:sulfate transport system substrate-binding protein
MSRTPLHPAARAAVVATTAALALGLAACSGSSSASDKVAVVGYSVPQPAYDALEAAFQNTDAGKDVTFTSSFGASGSQSKAVAAGQKADYVAFSVEPDVQNLVPAKVDASWSSDDTQGNVSDSVVVIVTRKGNPQHIAGWDDIVKPGVKIVTADPASSGSAKWNILAAYEHELATGGTEDDAKAYLTKFFGNTVSRASSGAVAMTQFLGGTGDVLISYEDEAIAARQAGNDVDYVVPDDTFLIENPAAVTKTASKSAQDFLAFVKSDDGQKIFASKGFRPVSKSVEVGTVEGANDPAHPFPEVKKLTTIADLGGWDAVNKKFFGDGGLVTAIEGDS